MVIEHHLRQAGKLLQMKETSKSPRLLSAPRPLPEERPDPVQTARVVVFLHHLFVPWTLVSCRDEQENLFEVDLELRFQDSPTSPLDPLHKLALLRVQGSINSVLEDKNRLADAIVDPKDGQAAAGFCVGGAEVGWVGGDQDEGREGFWGSHNSQEILLSFYCSLVEIHHNFLFLVYQLCLRFHNFDLSNHMRFQSSPIFNHPFKCIQI